MQNPVTMLNRVAVGDAIRRTAWMYPNKEVIVDGENALRTNNYLWTQTNLQTIY